MKRWSFVLVIIASLLGGCVAAVLGSVAAGIIVYDRRSLSTIESDARIFHLIHKAIVTDPRFARSHIEVISFNRVVLLVGETPAASLRVLAQRIAQKTPGVSRVYNEISINTPYSITDYSKDTWITSQVRSQLLTRSGLESGSIRVVTENRQVYLMGIVTPEQSYAAVDAARQIKGVAKVVKVFQYIR